MGGKEREEGKRGVSEQKNHEIRPTKWKQTNSQQSVSRRFLFVSQSPPLSQPFPLPPFSPPSFFLHKQKAVMKYASTDAAYAKEPICCCVRRERREVGDEGD